MTTNKRPIRPIRFSRLFPGSNFRIFAEPSRDIQKSRDERIYRKECEAWSVDLEDEKHCIILMPEDLVEPLTRGQQ